MIIILDPPDACPACPPGIPDASLPVGIPEPASGGVLADYECGTCGCAWSARFDEYGWVIDRSIAPVAPERRAA